MTREKAAMIKCMPTLSVVPIHVTFPYLPGPGGGMADAEDLKSKLILPIISVTYCLQTSY